MTSRQMPLAYDAGQQYRDFGAELLKMIQSGQITPQRANQLKASVYEATRLGNTPQGEAAMKAALSSSRSQMPLQGYSSGQQYQDFGQKLAGMIQSGQITPQQANALKAPVAEAMRLGDTSAGKAAMDAALASSSGKLPLQGYDGGQQYQAFGQELAGMLQSGQITPQQANALKSQVYEASRLGNTSAGKAAMDAAISASRAQMPKAAPQGGLTVAEQPEIVVTAPQPEMPVMPQRPQTVTPQRPQPEMPVMPPIPQNPQMVTPPPMPQPPVQVMPQPPVQVMPEPTPMPQPSPFPAQGLTGMPPIPQPPVQNLTLSNAPQNLTLSNVPQTLTLGSTSAPQTPVFDRNASLQQLNGAFGNLRNTYGEEALRNAGFTPAAFQGFQRTMRDLQMDKNSTQEQHTAALQNALNNMNSYTNNLKPISQPGGGIGAFLGKPGEAPQGVGTPPVASQQLINALTPQPKQGSFVDTMPMVTAPAPTGPQVMAPNAQGMALGGLMRKYGGMC